MNSTADSLELRVAIIRNVLSAAQERLTACRRMLDRLPMGVVMLNESGRVVDTSSVAQSHLKGALALRCENGRLIASAPEDDRRLRRLIGQVLRSRRDRVTSPAQLRIRPRVGSNPVIVRLI